MPEAPDPPRRGDASARQPAGQPAGQPADRPLDPRVGHEAMPSVSADAVLYCPPLVVIGASWGGLHAMSTILAALPASFEVPIVLVQHRSKESDGLLAGLLQDVTALVVCDVEDKEPIQMGHVYIAPPDYHLLVDDGGFSLSSDAAVRYSRPSIDVAFASAADACGGNVLGALLTGANDDGARGLRRIVDRGGRALVQDPATAEVRTMPEAGLRMLQGAPADRWSVAPLTEIGGRIAAHFGTGRARRGGAARDARWPSDDQTAPADRRAAERGTDMPPARRPDQSPFRPRRAR